jgi:hypothetical protein
MQVALNNIGNNHTSCILQCSSSGTAVPARDHFDVSNYRAAGSQAVITRSWNIILTQNETVTFSLTISGGPKAIGLVAALCSLSGFKVN